MAKEDDEDVLTIGLSDLFHLVFGDQAIISRSALGVARRLLSDEHREEMDRECEDLGEEFVRISVTSFDRFCAALADALDA